VPVETFAARAKEVNADIVGVSALLTTTMVGMKDAIDAIREAEPGTRILVGGAPVTDEYAVEVGADGYARDAATAAVVAQELLAASA